MLFRSNNKEIRAFIFERKGDYYVIYWHISGYKQVELAVNHSDVKLYTNFGQEEQFESHNDGSIIIPANNRRYIKFNNMSREQIIDIFENAKIVD